MNTVLITGGCGFIGTSLIASLLEIFPDSNIRVLDNLTTGTLDDLSEVAVFEQSSPEACKDINGVVFIQGDIRDAETANLCARNSNCIIHLAANTGVGPSVEFPRTDMECNVVGTFNMLEAARLNKVTRFIFASSGAPAGVVQPPIHEEMPTHPVSPYGSSKLAGEAYCSSYYQTFGINTVCLRFGNVYGPRSKKKSSVVAKFIRQAMNNETCVIYGDGSQTRDFLYIDDLLRAVHLSMQKSVGGEIFQIASGKERTVTEMVQLIARTLEKRNIMMEIVNDSPRLGDVSRNYSDTRKAKKILGWEVKMDIEQGIEKTIEYFLEIKNTEEARNERRSS